MRWKAYKPNAKLPKTEWHRWFAWYPVEIQGIVLWLEFISRVRTRDPYTRKWGWTYSTMNLSQLSGTEDDDL